MNRNPAYLLVGDEVATSEKSKNEMIGDLTSIEKGTGARANIGKPKWELMILGHIGAVMEYSSRIIMTDHASDVGDSLMMYKLGDFQAGKISAKELFLDSVAYNLAKQKDQDLELLESLENVIRVWDYGLKKYEPFNWAKGTPWMVAIGCAARHIKAHYEGKDFDDESGELHSAHVVCNTMMLYHYSQYYEEGDDRPLHVF